MNSCKSRRYFGFAFTFLVVSMSGSILQADSGVSAEVKHLNELWVSRARDLSTIDVKGFKFSGLLKPGEAGFVNNDLVKMMTDVLVPVATMNPGINELQTATSGLFPSMSDNTRNSGTEGTWSEFSFVCDPNNSRMDKKWEGRFDSIVRSGTLEKQYFSGSKQASLYTSHSGRSMPRIDTFCYNASLPHIDRSWQLLPIAGGNSRLSLDLPKGKAILLDFEPSSGFIAFYGVRSGALTYALQRYQFAPIATVDGIPMPRVVADFSFGSDSRQANDLPKFIEIFVVTEVEVNRPIDPSRFDLAVPVGTNVVQFAGADSHIPPSEGGVRPPMKRTAEIVSDVQQFATRPDFQRPSKEIIHPQLTPRDLRDSKVLWILAGNAVGICFALLAVLIVRKKVR